MKKITTLMVVATFLDHFNPIQAKVANHVEMAAELAETLRDGPENLNNIEDSVFVEQVSDASVELVRAAIESGKLIMEAADFVAVQEENPGVFLLATKLQDKVVLSIPNQDTMELPALVLLQVKDNFGFNFFIRREDGPSEILFDVGLSDYFTRLTIQSEKIVSKSTLRLIKDFGEKLKALASTYNDPDLEKVSKIFLSVFDYQLKI